MRRLQNLRANRSLGNEGLNKVSRAGVLGAFIEWHSARDADPMTEFPNKHFKHVVRENIFLPRVSSFRCSIALMERSPGSAHLSFCSEQNLDKGEFGEILKL
jgi:hypothetical protein